MEAVGFSLSDIKRVHVWLSTDADIPVFNAGYQTFFAAFAPTNPARAISLGTPISANGARIEIEFVAYRKRSE